MKNNEKGMGNAIKQHITVCHQDIGLYGKASK